MKERVKLGVYLVLGVVLASLTVIAMSMLLVGFEASNGMVGYFG